MYYHYKTDYRMLSDRQIVEKILEKPHDEEAAVFLLRERYNPLLQSIYKYFTNDMSWYDDFIDELFLLLKGKEGAWRILACFEWRCTLGYWLKGVAFNKFRELMSKLIENKGRNESLDSDSHNKSKRQIPSVGEEIFEQNMQRVMLIEAIAKLRDDERFVILKRLQGYNSREIAILLQKSWIKRGIVKKNHNGDPVIPTEDYVNVRIQRAKRNLKKIIVEK